MPRTVGVYQGESVQDSVAHQVLSHADSRARYDAKGKEGLEEVNFMEASTFYQARP